MLLLIWLIAMFFFFFFALHCSKVWSWLEGTWRMMISRKRWKISPRDVARSRDYTGKIDHLADVVVDFNKNNGVVDFCSFYFSLWGFSGTCFQHRQECQWVSFGNYPLFLPIQSESYCLKLTVTLYCLF